MLLSKWVPFALITGGIMIMTVNIIEYFAMARQMSNLKIGRTRGARAMLRAYISLLCFFLLGYLAVDVSFFIPAFSINDLLVGLIFFFGSVFVLIGIVLQKSLGRVIGQANLEVTQALITAVEARDKNLNGHSLHVAGLAALIYEWLPREQQRRINPVALEYAGLLHDIGKLGVPEVILNKDGTLNAEEWEVIRRHPLIGKQILKQLGSFDEISDWVLYHHKRCDGKGYMGLKLAEIPYPALIIAVADTFSALTMKRSYRESRSFEAAAQVLRECRGTQLDAGLVDLFLSIPQERVEACRPVTSSPELYGL